MARLSPEEAAALGLPSQPARRLGADEAAALGLPTIGDGPSTGGAFLRSAAQGATFGFADELAGAAKAAARSGAVPPGLGLTPKQAMAKYPGLSATEAMARAAHDNADAQVAQAEQQRLAQQGLYRTARDEERAKDAATEQAHPVVSFLGNVAGGAATIPLTGGAQVLSKGGALAKLAAAAKTGAEAGALYGAGGSQAEDVSGLGQDVAVGAGVGGLLGGGLNAVGQGMSKGLDALRSRAAAKVADAESRIAARATAEKTSEQAALTGKYGGLRQTENKAILNLLQMEQSGMLDEANAAALQKLKDSGRAAEALNEAARNNAEFLSQRMPEVASAKAAMQQGAESLPQAIEQRSAELGSPQEAGAQFKARLKRYGPVLAAGALGNAMGGPVAGLAGLAGGFAGRPALRALGRMVDNPAIQKQLYGRIAGALEAPMSRIPATEAELRAAALAQLLRQQSMDVAAVGAAADEGP